MSANEATQSTQSAGHPNPSVWWKHRRRLCYGSFVWVILQTFLWAAVEVMVPGTIAGMSVVIGWSYGVPATAIIGYYGNTAVEEFVKHKRIS